MEIKFVDPSEIRKGGSVLPVVRELTEALKEHPNRWAELPIKVSTGTSVNRWKTLFPDFEFKGSGGNNFATGHPDKKLWTIYVRYSPKSEGK
jgi:hypothetical protein